MGVKINTIHEVDISCKNVSYEMVTNLGATAGAKRKRAEAQAGSEDIASEEKNDTEIDEA